MAALEPSAINGTSDRERIEALHTGVQALTSLFEGFSTRTAEDAALHWQLSGELKARLDNQDQMLQALACSIIRLRCYKHLLINQACSTPSVLQLATLPGSVEHTNCGQQPADASGGNDVSLCLFVYRLFVCLFVCGGYGTCNGQGDSNIGTQPFIVSVKLYERSGFLSILIIPTFRY
ncbi:hypothetical protein HOY82DRAFT_495433 [Tuber indicum]|nr:hypothetical protein HOY82DRAFT_495433 [Tuber indicum]